MRIERPNDQFLPGPAGLAGRHGIGRSLLSVDEGVSAGRTICDVLANQACILVNSGKHRRRIWAGANAVIRSISPHCTRLTQGTGNTSVAGGTGRIVGQPADRRAHGSVHEAREETPSAYPFSAAENIKTLRPLTTHHSPLTTHHSPFATHHSPTWLDR